MGRGWPIEDTAFVGILDPMCIILVSIWVLLLLLLLVPPGVFCCASGVDHRVAFWARKALRVEAELAPADHAPLGQRPRSICCHCAIGSSDRLGRAVGAVALPAVRMDRQLDTTSD